MKAVFTTKLGSGYDDIVEKQYHFPATYLAQVENAVGDLIVYYEPRRQADAATGGRQAYFAMARVVSVDTDSSRNHHYYARLADFLDFDRAVPFRAEERYFESILQRADGETNKGAFGRSVRSITDEEFDLILAAGFPMDVGLELPSNEHGPGLYEPPAAFARPVIEVTGTRLFRDRAFARHIQLAYNRTCAMTGLQIINGGGRPEAQAAHIQPVARDGDDSVRNGIALSSTLHWMFDRGLISVDTDYRILLAPTGVPDAIRRLINPTGKLVLPNNAHAHPHPHYLSFHRQNVFKG
jgi:putative restriction endonuclease